MKVGKWKNRLLSTVLCLSLLISNLSISSYAMEIDTLGSKKEAGLQEVSGNDAVLQEEVTEAAVEELVPITEVLSEENSEQCFSDIQVTFSGYDVEAQVTFAYPGGEENGSYEVYLEQYDKDDNYLCAKSLGGVFGTEPATYLLSCSNTALHKDTSYLCFKVEIGEDTYTSEIITRPDKRPQVTFEAEQMSVGSGMVAYKLSYTGNMELAEGKYQGIQVEFNVGTEDNPDSWSVKQGSVLYFWEHSKTCDESFTYLEPSTTYWGELIFYVEAFDEKIGTLTRVMEQKVPISSFTTKENVTYDITEIFPDEAFRNIVTRSIVGENVVDNQVTRQMLESVENIWGRRNSYEDAAVKELTGIEYLTELISINLDYHEVEDITEIDWSKFLRLQTLSFKGNELTKLPDLSANDELTSCYFAENKLPEDEIKKAREKLPTDIDSNTFSNQRTNGLKLITEDTYYMRGTETDLYIVPTGFKTGLAYTFKFYINDTEVTFNRISEYDSIYKLMGASYPEGEYRLKAEFYIQGEKAEETVHDFSIKKQEVFASEMPYYMGGDRVDSQGLSIAVYSQKEWNEVEKIYLVNDAGKVYAESTYVNTNSYNSDPRYQILWEYCNYYLETEQEILNINSYLAPTYNYIPAGSYHLEISFIDGTTEMVHDMVMVTEREEEVISSCYVSSEYDQTGEYIYVTMIGNNIAPKTLSYRIEQRGVTYGLSYVNYKKTGNGVVAKLKKEGWIKLADNYDSTFIIEGANEATKVSSVQTINSDIYYVAYNPTKDRVEAAFAAAMEADGKTVNVSLRKEGYVEVIASGSAVISGGLASIEFKDFAMTNGNYFMDFTIDGKEYTKLVNIWNIITYNTYPESVQEEDRLPSGQETLAVNNDKFIINYEYGSWKDENTLQFMVATTATGKNDKYTVILTEPDGEQIQGLTTTIAQKSSYNIYLDVTGLKYQDAPKKFYYKIVHNTLGEPYESDGTAPYFRNEYGNYKEFYYSWFSYLLQDQSCIGIDMARAALPVTVNLYRPYQTEPVKTIEITSKSQLTGRDYYFTRAFCESLPGQDDIYDIICIDANNRVGAWTERTISYQRGVGWDYTLDKTELYFDDVEKETAIITVTDNKQSPAFKSSNTEVVTVKADPNDPNRGIITAVGSGFAEIVISADNITRHITVSVNRRFAIEAVELNYSAIKLTSGEEAEIIASVLPVQAQTEKYIWSFTMENAAEAVEFLPNEELGTVVVKAKNLAAGTATLVATLTNTETQQSISSEPCVITVGNTFTDEQQRELVQSAGTKYVLLNTYTKSAATLTDVQAPTGWTWVDNSIKLQAEDTNPIQYFAATYQQEGYEPFTAMLPVAVSRLTAVSVTGASTVSGNGQSSYQAVGIYKGYQPEGEEYTAALSYQWSVTGNPSVAKIVSDTSDKVNVMIRADEVEKKVSQTLSLAASVGGKDFKASLKLNIIPSSSADSIEIKAASEQPATAIPGALENYGGKLTEITVDNSIISNEKNKEQNTLRLDAVAYAGGIKTEPAKGFKWISSDASVIAVKAESGNTGAVLTFKKPGSAVLSVTAQDDGKFVQEILVTVKDYAPVLENNKIALDYYAKSGVVLPMKVAEENRITAVQVLEQDSSTKAWQESEKLMVDNTRAAEGIFALKTKQGYQPAGNQSIKVQFKVTTDKMVKDLPATIALNVKTKPTASLKVFSKANLFYKNAVAIYQLSSKYEIESVEDITGRESTAEGFRLAESYSPATGKILLDTRGTLNEDNLSAFKAKKSPLCQVTLKVNFAGYTDEADQIIMVTVATEDKKPSLKLNDVTVFEGVGESTTGVFDTKAKTAYVLDSSYSIASSTDGVQLKKTEEGKIQVSYLKNKNISYKAELTSSRWTQPLPLKGKISVNAPGKLEMVLENSKVILNKEYNIQKQGKLEIPVGVKNNSTIIEKVTYQIDKNNRALFDKGYLYLTFSQTEQKLYLGLNKGMGEDIKAGTYKVNLIGHVEYGNNSSLYSLKATTLTITISDKAPTVALKASGSIDLVRRAATAIIYTPTFKNVTAKAKSVTLSGAYAEYFTASVEYGKIVVRAVEGKAMSTKLSYPVKIELTLDNGARLSPIEVKIKPVNKLPKVTAELTKATLYKAYSGELSFKVKTGNDIVEISGIRPVADKNSKCFDIRGIGSEVTVTLNEEAKKMKPGNYTISYIVDIKDAAYDVKPTTLKLTVTVK